MSETTQPSAPPSPDVLDLKGNTTKGRGVRRLNRVPLLIIGGIATLVMIVVFITMYQKAHPSQPTAATAPKDGAAAASLPSDLNMPTGSEIAANVLGGSTSAAPPPAMPVPSDGSPQQTRQNNNAGMTDANDPNQKAWAAYYQAQSQIAARQQQQAMSAFIAGSGVSMHQESPTTPAPGTPAAAPGSDLAKQLLANALAQKGGENGDPNAQQAKRDFLNNTVTPTDYLAHTRTAPLSPLEVKAGSVIPAVMISGLNSDLPGQIIAQVTENVYDTKSGHHLLIPQGAKLIGTYDNGVTLGQERALTAWRRVIFPDATSLDLDLMPGADQSGYAGFNDQVNNHYAKIFGSAVMVSLFSAGIQLSQPQQSGFQISNQQVIAGALGQQLGQLGMEVTRRNMQIQPTIEIRPGYRFNVMVTKDLVLPAWRDAQ